jgi:ribosomal protein L3 glutamine methyltransferase
MTSDETLLHAIQRTAASLEAAGLFFGHGTDSAWDEAVAMVLFSAGLPPDSGSEVASRPMSEAALSQLETLCLERINRRIPLPYLLGEAWFAGRRFLCDERALVPRSPIAELILNDYQPWYAGPAPTRLLDLCCGGGAIGITAALEAPELAVTLSDIDPAALDLAVENIALHGVGDRVTTVCSDLFDSLDPVPYDIILCNPPYVDARDMSTVPDEYRHEPEHGLAAGADGLDLVRRILPAASRWLAPHGLLVLEVGNSWEALEAAFPDLPFLWPELEQGGHGVCVLSCQDLAGSAAGTGRDAYNPAPGSSG